MKQAVILAAGRGMRLGNAGSDSPKCLLNIGGRSLLELQLSFLFQAGIESVCIVAGHRIEDVRRHVADFRDVTVIHNPIYATTNSLYSLSLAKDWVRGPFLCINGDVICHPDILSRVMAVKGCALAYDSSSGQDEEHMKIHHSGGFLRVISKQLDSELTQGESVGLLQFDAVGAACLFATTERLLQEEGEMLWAPAVLNKLLHLELIRCVDVCGLPWTEIDFPEDLDKVRQEIWPRICSLHMGFSGLPCENSFRLRASPA